MTAPFPFELVYETIARTNMAEGLPKDDILQPHLLLVTAYGGRIHEIRPVPESSAFFNSNASKELLGRALRMMMQRIEGAGQPAAIVLVAEMHMRKATIAPGADPVEEGRRQRAQMPADLSTDPLAEEGLMIQIHRPEGIRAGYLPITSDRKLEYQPLAPTDAIFDGRLNSQPQETPPGATKH